MNEMTSELVRDKGIFKTSLCAYWKSEILMGKIVEKALYDCRSAFLTQKRTPSDCFFGDFAHWNRAKNTTLLKHTSQTDQNFANPKKRILWYGPKHMQVFHV